MLFSWSFGIVLWEIFTLGGTPYPSLPTENLLDFLSEGNRMAKPHNCPDKVYNIMRECWQIEPETRPSFAALSAQLEQYLEDNVRKVSVKTYCNPLLVKISFTIEKQEEEEEEEDHI